MIQIRNLRKSYGERILFDRFNFQCEKPEMIAFVGPSGKGKTTLLNIIGSLETFDGGHVRVLGKELEALSFKEKVNYLKDDVSFLFQNFALMENRSIKENILMGQRMDDTMLYSLLEQLQLSCDLKRHPVTLSGGEQQRIALARIMLKPSKIILADEPTGNLDQKNSDIVWQSLLNFKKQGKVVLVVTHEQEVLTMFDRVIEL